MVEDFEARSGEELYWWCWAPIILTLSSTDDDGVRTRKMKIEEIDKVDNILDHLF